MIIEDYNISREDNEYDIFIWKQYGDVHVYYLESEKDWVNLFKMIVDSLNYLQAEEMVSEGEKILLRSKSYSRAIWDMIKAFGFDTHETFEYGTSFDVLNKPWA